jgi:hypothetical protein
MEAPMTEYPEIPAPPPPRKRAAWKIIIPIVVIVLLCCLCLVVVGVLVYLGTQGNGPFASLQTNNPLQILSSSITGDWDLYYSWDCSDDYSGPATLTINSDGTFTAVEDTSGGSGTWTLSGDNLDYLYVGEPYAHYVGTVNSSRDYFEGTMTTADGGVGCFYANKK